LYKWEKIDSNKVCLEVEIPMEEVNKALEQAYKKVVKQINVPGFRKGRVPRKVLETRFGSEIFSQDALELLIDPAYKKAVKECRLEPIDQPEITELEQIEKDKPLVFKVNVEVKPEVELGNYLEGITVEMEKQEFSDADVDQYFDSLLEQHARLVTIEDEEARLQKKDLAVIDFTGTIDGEPFEGGEAEAYSLEIGSGSFIDTFEEQLIGVGRGEEKEIQATFPENYHQQELAGKEAVFQVAVKEIKRPRLPELNDEFVQELTEEFDTMAEFRADIEKKLRDNHEGRKKIALETKVVEKAATLCEVVVPNVLIEREVEGMLGEFDYYLRMQGLSLEQYGQMIEGGLEKLKEERREEAEKNAKANLVLDAIIKKEEIKATEEEIEAKINEIVLRQHQEVDLDEIKAQFEKEGRLDIIEHEIRYRKVIDFLVEHAKVIEAEPMAEQEKAGQESKEEGAETTPAAAPTAVEAAAASAEEKMTEAPAPEEEKMESETGS
jgi:trigger factor